MSINKELATSRGLSDEVITAIEVLNKKLTAVLTRPMLYFDSYKDACKHVEHMEFVLQNLWGFPIDDRFHRYWNQFKECTCPKSDSSERWGTGERIISTDCPVHEWMTLEIVRGVRIDE